MHWTVLAFGGSWIALLIVSLWEGRPATIRTAVAMLGNWAVGLIFGMATDLSTAWWFFLPLDVATAWYVLQQPAGKPQGIIASLLVMQIAAHCSYAINELLNGAPYATELKYWNVLTGLAALQAISVGGGIGGGILVRLYRRHVRRDRALAGPPHFARSGLRR